MFLYDCVVSQGVRRSASPLCLMSIWWPLITSLDDWNSLYVLVCVLRARLKFFWFRVFFDMEGFCSGFSAFLPVSNYKFKFKQTYVTCGVEVKQLFETAKACTSSLKATYFLQTRVSVLFRTIVLLFVFVGLVHLSRLRMVQFSTKVL